MGSEEADRKQEEREREMTCNKGPWLESHQGRCGHVACTLATGAISLFFFLNLTRGSTTVDLCTVSS